MTADVDKVMSYFGYWPEFADGRIERFEYVRAGCIVMSIRYIDAEKAIGALVTLGFSGVSDVDLSDPNGTRLQLGLGSQGMKHKAPGMRVLVTGASGAGTTTLGRALAEQFGVSFFDADDYYWLPTHPLYKTKRDAVSRLSLFLAEAAHATSSGLASDPARCFGSTAIYPWLSE